MDGGAAPQQTSAPSQASGGGGGATLSVAQAQQRLNEMGYNVGTPDGDMGARTANGLRAFQRANGLAVTGRLDSATMDALSRR